MKKWLLLPLMAWATVASANNALSCGAVRELETGVQVRQCVFQGTSFSEAVAEKFKDALTVINFHSYEHIGVREHVEVQKIRTDDGEKTLEQRIKWATKNKVNVSLCEQGTDACGTSTFELKDGQIVVEETIM